MSNSDGSNTPRMEQPETTTVVPAEFTVSNTSSADQWRLFLGLTILVGSYILRVEVVRFSLRVVRRIIPALFTWLREFEKMLLRPLSWVVFVLLAWFSTYVMDLESLMDMDSGTFQGIATLLLGPPLVWLVISFCNYVAWGIIRVQGWSRAVSKDDDDYSRVLIITEGIGVCVGVVVAFYRFKVFRIFFLLFIAQVIKVLLVMAVVSTCIIDEIGQFTDFESGQVSTVAVIMAEFVFVFGAHSWLKNIMGGLMSLQDEQIKSGLHVSFQGHEGVVERLFLQGFSLRQYDKGVAYIPNSIMLENSVMVQTKSLERRCIVPVHLSHSTPTTVLRIFIQELDNFLMHHMMDCRMNLKANVLGLEKPRGGWGIMNVYESSKQLAMKENQPRDRFWISIEAPYLVHVVYYSQERHIKRLLAEKTEIVLRITELITKLKLNLHRKTEAYTTPNSVALVALPSSGGTEASDVNAGYPSFSPESFAETSSRPRRRRAPPASEPRGQRILSDDNMLRYRRPLEDRAGRV